MGHHAAGWEEQLASRGAATFRAGIAEADLLALKALAAPGRAGRRNLLGGDPVARRVAESGALAEAARAVLGDGARPVRIILFDKTADANWAVPWHQDLNIAVEERRDVPGYGPWSTKAGVCHVVPPEDVLRAMVTLRLHLDDCGEDNGPLVVLEGSHRLGRIADDAIASVVGDAPGTTLCARRGEVIAMRPLTLHRSPSARVAGHRRVFHVEYAAHALDGGLRWAAP